MKFSFLILGFTWILAVESLQAAPSEPRLFSKWAVNLDPGLSSLDRVQVAGLAGITVISPYFYIPSAEGFLEKRLLKTGEVMDAVRLEGPSQMTWQEKGGLLYGGDTKGNLYCVDATTMKILWKTPTKGVFFSGALVSDAQVWVMSSLGNLQSYDRHTGGWLWTQAEPQGVRTQLWSPQAPVLFQGKIIAGFPSGDLIAFDPVSGAQAWKESFSNATMGSESFNDLKSITVKAEFLVASSFGGNLKAWKAQGPAKKPIWEKPLSLYAPMTLGENGIGYVSGRDGSLRAIEIETGYEIFKYELPRGIANQARLVGDRLWIGSSTGEIYVLSLEGKLVAKMETIENSFWNPLEATGFENTVLALSSGGILRALKLN